MTRRRCLSVAAVAFDLWSRGWCGLLAPPEPARRARAGPTCWEGYGTCYKATNNRQRCQAHLQRCLNGCIRSRAR